MEASKANIVEAFNQNREDFTGAQRQIGTDHGYIHEGKGFSYSKSATINTGSSLLLMFITGANKYIHLRPTVISSMAGAVTVKVKEGGTYIKPAGTPVSGEDVLNFTAFTQPVALSNQNYNGGEITVNSVTGSVDGLLTVTDHYENAQDVLSAWGIQLNDGDGVLVSDAAQTMNFTSFNDLIDFANQNHDGSIITVVSVTGTEDGLLTVTTDYTVKLSGSDYGIQLVSGGKITTLDQDFAVVYQYTPPKITTFEQDFTVNYDYTPAASPETVYNRNRNSAEITTIDGVYVSPTESVAGAVLWNTSVGSGGSPQSRSGGSLTGESDEWVLKPNEEYVIEIANSSGSNSVVNINLFWYEEDEGV
jgi:hypothetical protein